MSLDSEIAPPLVEASDREVAAYVEDLLVDLRGLTSRPGLAMLCYLLEMARLEAAQLREDRMRPRSRGPSRSPSRSRAAPRRRLIPIRVIHSV